MGLSRESLELFDYLLEKMKAPEIIWKSGPVLTSEEKRLMESADGLELNLAQLEKHICKNGMVAIDGRPAVLWIKKTDNPVKDLLNDPKGPHIKRFHIFADCTAMKRMKALGKFDKYAVGYRQDGKFNVFGTEGRKVFGFRTFITKQKELKNIELGVCINCLQKANFQSINEVYPSANRINLKQYRIDFNIKEYFKEYGQEKFLHPKHTDASYPNPKEEYGQEFIIAKLKFRKALGKRGYICDDCGVDLSELKNRDFHDIHHKNALSTDHDFSNLRGLCIVCHSKVHKRQLYDDKRMDKCRKIQKQQGKG